MEDLDRDGLIEGGAKRVRRVAAGGVDGRVLANTIGIVVAEPLLGDTPYAQPGWPSFVQIAATAATQRASMQSLSVLITAPVDRAVDQILAARPGGLVTTFDATSTPFAAQAIAAIRAAGVRLVAHDDNVDTAPWAGSIDRVCTDHYVGGRMLAEALLSRGCRKILRIYRMPDRTPFWDRRDAAFEAVHAAAGLAVLPPVRTPHMSANDNSSTASNFELEARLLMSYLYDAFKADPSIDTIVASSDRAAYGVAAACRMLGKEPGRDVLIAGYDNSWAAAPERAMGSCPPALTIDKHHDQIGRSLVELLIDRMEGRLPSEPQTRIVEPTLVALG